MSSRAAVWNKQKKRTKAGAASRLGGVFKKHAGAAENLAAVSRRGVWKRDRLVFTLNRGTGNNECVGGTVASAKIAEQRRGAVFDQYRDGPWPGDGAAHMRNRATDQWTHMGIADSNCACHGKTPCYAFALSVEPLPRESLSGSKRSAAKGFGASRARAGGASPAQLNLSSGLPFKAIPA